jgi:hypothetical protein
MTGLRKNALIAGAAVLLLLLQTLVPVISAHAQTAMTPGGQGAVLTLAGELCESGSHDGGKAPVQHHHQHCALCVAGNRNPSLDGAAVLLIVTTVALAIPQSEAAPIWPDHNDPKLSSSGWGRSWSSRAPPSFS